MVEIKNMNSPCFFQRERIYYQHYAGKNINNVTLV